MAVHGGPSDSDEEGAQENAQLRAQVAQAPEAGGTEAARATADVAGASAEGEGEEAALVGALPEGLASNFPVTKASPQSASTDLVVVVEKRSSTYEESGTGRDSTVTPSTSSTFLYSSAPSSSTRSVAVKLDVRPSPRERG